ncbi:MAG: nucleoside monophosphate kinase [Verrucomicrobiia bacterium]|tara:strand:- start:4828 stop:5904 length:1077 start_codon:yes stop_codon:yes gene_type:complete
MVKTDELPPNTFFIEVSGSGLPEIDGLFVPSTAPPAKSESGTVSSLGYWNGKMAWDRADGKAARSPALSFSNSYSSWRISRLDGHLAYEITCEDEMPPTDREWSVYKKGVVPAPKVVLHHHDPRQTCPKPNIVFVLGGPGTGKGTMCELVECQLGWTHLSTGDLLRAEHQAGGPNADTIQEFIDAGKLVPNDITVTLLKHAMEKAIRTTGKKNFLVDGFPRSLNNMEGWYEIFGREAELPKMLYFECPYPVLEKRISGRAKWTGRSDDNIESVKLRFDTFKAETLPTVELFQSKNKCVEIDTSQDRQAVYALVTINLAEHTDKELAAQPLTERAEIILGLRAYPKEVQSLPRCAKEQT